MPLTSGARLGPYEILSPLGAGGMGEVWRARDTKLGRDVAIKVLPQRLASDPEALARFEREARAVASLSHPNILAIHDFGKDGDTTYAVMELLEGETLRTALSGGALPMRKAAEWAAEIARGLAAAHARGIVHRDLKPDNVFVTQDGRVKILDFGLARPSSAAPSGSDTRSPTVTGHTEPGTILGTVGYMSPEQVRGVPVDARSDIFSLGAVLYEMLTGRRAFQGPSQAETLAAILQSDPQDSSAAGTGVPAALERVVRRCLEKKPEQRFQSAQDLAFALDSLVAPSGSAGASVSAAEAPAKRPRTAGPLLWAALGAVLSGAIVFLALRTGRREQPATAPPAVRFTIAPPPGAMLQGMLAIGPDGRRLAFVATGADGRDRLFVRELDATELRSLEGTEGAASPFWSPDSRSIAFFAQGKLKRIDAAGGSAKTLCDAVGSRGGSWGRGGTIVFSASTGGEIRRVSEDGGNSTALPGLDTKGVSHRWPAFLPDGRHFVYCAMGEQISLSVGSLDSAKTTRLTSSDGGAVYAAPGFLLYRSGDRLMARRFDADKLLLSGEAFPVIDHVWWDGIATGATAMSVSDNGLLACQTGGAVVSRLLWYDRSGRELKSVGPDGAYWEPTLSPDDRWLAVPRMDPERVAADLCVVDLERGGLTRLASQALVPASPLWSGDARRVVYSSFGTGEVLLNDARGLEGEKALFRQPSFTPLDDWSRDGRLLFYDVIDFKRFHSDIWVRDMQTGTSRPVLQAAFNEQSARLSPDGRWLAYESEESGAYEIYVRSFPGAGERRQVSKGGGQQPRWRRDGKELFYVSADRKIMAVEILPGPTLEAGVARALFQTRIRPQVESRNHYDVTSDGQRFIVNSYRPEDAALPITVLSPWVSPKR